MVGKKSQKVASELFNNFKNHQNKKPTKKFEVRVEDTFSYPDADRLTIGTFNSYDEALIFAKKRIIDYYVNENPDYPNSPESLNHIYFWGEDVWVTPTPEGEVCFSSSEWVKKLIEEGQFKNAKEKYGNQ